MITCPALHEPSNGTRLGCPGNATMNYDTTCQFSCNNGYIGSGSQVRRCQHNGTWSGQEFTCQSTIFNTEINLILNNTVTRKTAFNDSLKINIINVSTHLFLFYIAVIMCPALPEPSNGTRVGCPGNATMYYDTACPFSCNNGYIGSGSQVRRCQHNGTWSGQDFTCQSTLFF